MRNLILLTITLAFLFTHCSTGKILHRKHDYTNGTMELHLKDSSREYQYFIWGHMGLRSYSAGTWQSKGNRLFLSGFNDNNIKEIKVESEVIPAPQGHNTQITIKYATDSFSPMLISQLLINDHQAYHVIKDTLLDLPYKVKTIQVRSYPYLKDALPSSPWLIDTLYAQKISIAENENKHVTLKFAVYLHDFYREKSSDTLLIKKTFLKSGKWKLK